MARDMTLAYTRAGAGEPLVLLHPLGLSSSAWEPVLPQLAELFDVLAVDLPGFGRSAALPDDVEPSPAALAAAVAELIDELGISRPHVVGNSLGGWIALELARLRPVTSLTLLSPAGLWRKRAPLYCRVSLRATRWFTRHAPRLLGRVVKYRLGRYLIFRQTHGRPAALTPERARTAIRDLGTSPSFPAALRASNVRKYLADPALDVPVTVAFGSRDLLLLPWQARQLTELPAHTARANLPGCGHVPMSDDPAAVAALILASAADRRIPTRDLDRS